MEVTDMSKTLVAYFSASGTTKSKAEQVASAIDADLFEIAPVKRYTREDLDWTNKRSRSTVEAQDASSRPAVENKISNPDQYDKVVIGFPIWWYTAPRIIETFLDENDLTGKKIYVFATSGGSGVDKCVNDLSKLYPSLDFESGKLLNGSFDESAVKNWLA
jgi:flavodoxin